MRAVDKLKSIKLAIFLDDGHEEYTNGDTIVGRAVVQLEKTVGIEDITVCYSVQANTVVRVRSRNSSNNSHTTYRDTLVVYQQCFRVFPPSELTNKSFTLQTGSHSFNFAFTIPETKLPPSWHSVASENMIAHLVHFRVKRPSWYKLNSEASKVIKFLPRPDPNTTISWGIFTTKPKKLDLNSKRQGVFARRQSQVSLTVRWPDAVALNSTFALTITFDSMPFQNDTKQPLKVKEVSIRLVSYMRATAKNYNTTHDDMQKMLLEKYLPSGPQGEVVELEVDTLKLGKLAPSFYTSNLSLRWSLEIVATVSNCYRGTSQTFKHTVSIEVVPGTTSQYPGGNQLPLYSKHEHLEGAEISPTY